MSATTPPTSPPPQGTPAAPESRWSLRALLRPLIAVVLLVGLSIWAWAQFFRTYHLLTVQDKVLYRTGLKSISEFQNTCDRVRPRTVISLADRVEQEKEPFNREMRYCTNSQIKYISMPVTLGGWPSTAQVRQFLELVAEAKRQPVLVHCAQGVRRTGMMVAAYQLSVLKFDKPRAKAAIERFGHSQRTVGDIERFIDTYDPQTREVTVDLPPSQE
jgi:protein tyrosine phosphatase (PTP) superfamily phosphohydrolase (DUF442 family)